MSRQQAVFNQLALRMNEVTNGQDQIAYRAMMGMTESEVEQMIEQKQGKFNQALPGLRWLIILQTKSFRPFLV